MTDIAPRTPSAGDPSRGHRIIAVLGPTNTGKTHFAIERLLGHASGMIGFPLRLLARENYDRMVKIKGPGQVALVTGEEKIVPPGARWFSCTVESMPLDRPVECLAVDEIQLSADPERGHIFTDRLLHARGEAETLFLGSDTMRPLIQKLVPGVEFVTRTRMSDLTYSGYKKLTRLVPRSAVVAFSASDVYGMAELIRRQRGGTAVVLGALSPRTRNAQVGMYQEGEVDYLVATDAIGMGLNMDIDHVAFARLGKFDGHRSRRLRTTEIAQIAGRAGRHTADGTFGTTADVGEIDQEIVEAVEGHEFPAVTSIMWRNVDLDFRSPGSLLRSLEAPAPLPFLHRARHGDDHEALQVLAQEEEIQAACRHPSVVRLLWEVCQIPDFRKVMSDHHTRLLTHIFLHLNGPSARLPVDWVAGQVNRLDNTEGDIDALVSRIAHVRTWTYVSHRSDWLADPRHWQDKARAIEDRLSDALHEKLTQRFVDKRSAMLARTLASGSEILAGVRPSGEVVVEGHFVGRLHGFRFRPDSGVSGEDARALMTAARRALKTEITARVGRLVAEPDTAFALQPDGRITWRGEPVARITPGNHCLGPIAVPLASDLLGAGENERLRIRLTQWLGAHIATGLGPLMALTDDRLSGAARGIAYQLTQALGMVRRFEVEPLIDQLARGDRKLLEKLGVRMGAAHVFMPSLAKPRAVALRAMLWGVSTGAALPLPVPPEGRVSLRIEGEIDPAFFAAIGYPACATADGGLRAIRVDMLDRVLRTLHGGLSNGVFAADPAPLARMLGCGGHEFEAIVAGFGWRREERPVAGSAPADPAALEEAEADEVEPEVCADDAAKTAADPATAEAPGPTMETVYRLKLRRGGTRKRRRVEADDAHPFAALKALNVGR